MLMPFHKLISTAPAGAHVWVPIDDENTMNYCIEYRARPAADRRGFAENSKQLPSSSIRSLSPAPTAPSLNKDNDY